MFGELIGLWILNELKYTGYQEAWQLVEFGPGTGKLMNDILRVLHRLKVVRLFKLANIVFRLRN